MNGSKVLSLGHYQPLRSLSNAVIERRLDTSDEWITRRVGIRSRRIAEVNETVSYMASRAAEEALKGSGIPRSDIDLVVVASCTAIERSPNVAARVAGELNLSAPAVIDVNTACSGFSHALAIADHSVRAGAAANALVVGADKLSGVVDWTDRSTAVLVGDGAGASVIGQSDTPGIGPVLWGSDPQKGKAIRIEGTPPVFAQDGHTVYRWAVTELPKLASAVCELAGVAPSELGAVVFHQANLRIIEKVAEGLGAVNAVISTDIVESGNTSAASIPIALSKLVGQNRVPSGTPILLFGFGGGLAYSGQVIRCP
ncbi:ketoacyl-ACP synthase III [Actinomadura montaniterrae]|uniref:Ketoacyl-ACP synthase III n=1 Tax=Actinomadura montaniterrae TaxID=1803903 RepID=A0A6L3VQA4_9ACTN|nr:beta-ketoacyl-ACP synthase III [Actinomadura montaniterrae]KAB2378980.1 ketoacyl-ACP synthase III [Actinomadura montaniterrae]